MNYNTETPKTDRAVQFAKQSIGNAPKVSAEFARTLEREAEAKGKENAKLREACKRLLKALNRAGGDFDDEDVQFAEEILATTVQ